MGCSCLRRSALSEGRMHLYTAQEQTCTTLMGYEKKPAWRTQILIPDNIALRKKMWQPGECIGRWFCCFGKLKSFVAFHLFTQSKWVMYGINWWRFCTTIDVKFQHVSFGLWAMTHCILSRTSSLPLLRNAWDSTVPINLITVTVMCDLNRKRFPVET